MGALDALADAWEARAGDCDCDSCQLRREHANQLRAALGEGATTTPTDSALEAVERLLGEAIAEAAHGRTANALFIDSKVAEAHTRLQVYRAATGSGSRATTTPTANMKAALGSLLTEIADYIVAQDGDVRLDRMADVNAILVAALCDRFPAYPWAQRATGSAPPGAQEERERESAWLENEAEKGEELGASVRIHPRQARRIAALLRMSAQGPQG